MRPMTSQMPTLTALGHGTLSVAFIADPQMRGHLPDPSEQRCLLEFRLMATG